MIVKDGINVAVEQGLWVSLMVNMAAICQRVEQGTFVSRQRTALIEILETLTKNDFFEGIMDIGKIPNPAAFMFKLLRPVKTELSKTELDPDSGKTYYQRVDPIPMMILTFEFPGMLKLLASQLGDIIPG